MGRRESIKNSILYKNYIFYNFRYDLDADGVVSSKEVGQIMRAIGQNPSEAEIQAYI